MFSKISFSTLLAFISFIATVQRGVQAPKNQLEAERMASSLQDIVRIAFKCDLLKWVRLFTKCQNHLPEPERKFWEDQTCKHLKTHKCAVGLMMTTLCHDIDNNKFDEWMKTNQEKDRHQAEMEQKLVHALDKGSIGRIEVCFPVPQQGKTYGTPFPDATEAQLAGAQQDMMFHKIIMAVHMQASKPVAKELFNKIIPIFDKYGLLLHVNLDSIVQVPMPHPCFGNFASVGGVKTVLMLTDCLQKVNEEASFHGTTIVGREAINIGPQSMDIRFKGISAFALNPIPHTAPIPAWTKPVKGVGFTVHFIQGAPTPIEYNVDQRRDGLLYAWHWSHKLGDAGRGTPLYMLHEGTFYLAGIQARYGLYAIHDDEEEDTLDDPSHPGGPRRPRRRYNVYYPLHEEQ